MAEKKKKNPISKREMLLRLQKNKDEEKLEQIKYTGRLLEMESSLIKSQIEDYKKPPQKELSLVSLPKSQSSVHLPPIKKLGLKEQKGFLDEIRGRNWKLYMSSREVIEGNVTNQYQNEELKRKLFKEKYRHYLQKARQDCNHRWQRLEELQNKQGAFIEDPIFKKKSATKEATGFKAAPEAQSKPVVVAEKPAQPKPVVEKAPAQPAKGKQGDQEF
jgi:Ni,Fe-hydrogenase I large subunit